LQLPESMKESQADLYLETYQVLDIEIGRLREMQRWQSSAAFKVRCTVILVDFMELPLIQWIYTLSNGSQSWSLYLELQPAYMNVDTWLQWYGEV
jgi:hypothetical protein